MGPSDSSTDEDSGLGDSPGAFDAPVISTRIELRTGDKHLMMQCRRSNTATTYSHQATGMDEDEIPLFLVNWVSVIQLLGIVGRPDQAAGRLVDDLIDLISHYLDEAVDVAFGDDSE